MKIIHTRKRVFENGDHNVEYTQYSMLPYEQIVTKLISKKYSLDEELAIYRKSISNPNNEEYLAYNAYVENCKLEAKQFIIERDAAIK